MKHTLAGLLASFLMLSAVSSFAGPQHWGSGYPYLVRVERSSAGARLCVYEPPLRAKDCVWLRRWVDSGKRYNAVLPGGVAVGDFWPAGVSKEYSVLLTKTSAGAEAVVAEAPEMFGTMPWRWSSGTALKLEGTVVQCSAGDLLGQKRDQLLVLTSGANGEHVEVWTVSGTPENPGWQRDASIPIAEKVEGFVCGDFWGEGKDRIGLIGSGRVQFMSAADGTLSPIVGAKSISTKPGLSVSGDFVKDGFDVVALAGDANSYDLMSAPLVPGTQTKEGPVYTGRALSGQPLPGFGGENLSQTMKAQIESDAAVVGAGVGRVFGYVSETPVSTIRKSHGIDPRPDAEIAFTSRFPLYSLTVGAPHYGWPFKDETFGYDVAIKNNGATPIPAGAKLSVWFGAKQRNADTDDATMGKPDRVIKIDQPIPPFDPMHPEYIKIRVEGKWPYSLVKMSPEATWMKVNLEEVGERWLVAKLDCPGDRTLRNNRVEAAFHAHTFHPIHRENTLADRVPTVVGDPCSLEYLSSKLADAETCVWERSRTTKNEDVLQRVYFDGYKIGFPDAETVESKRLAAWHDVQEWWEGWRELDIWTGENQTWEKYDWSYSPELHETEHLFHPLGDLYGNYVMPVWLRQCKMADGTPVQMRTNLWGPDLFGDGHALIGPAACELMKKYLVGARGAGIEAWWTVAPKTMKVQILDRVGKPVPGAEVTWWTDSKAGAIGSGKTDSNGCWDISSFFGALSAPDKIGVRHFYGDQNGGLSDFNAQLFTVKIGNYQDAAILGASDVNAHSRLSLLYHAMVNPDEWTWALKTNYVAGVPDPDFKLVSAIRGTSISIDVDGPKGKYALYRSWEPAYIREKIGEFDAGGDRAPMIQDMATVDGYGGARFRAIYEVTHLAGGKESLPRRLSVCGLKNGKGVSAMDDGRLVVATNAGIANPFAVIFDGTSPSEEFFYHYRFGHTAKKIIQSAQDPKRFYAILTGSDTKPPYGFDIAVPNATGAYEVRSELNDLRCSSFSGTTPQTLTLADAKMADRLNPGDSIYVGDNSVRITDKKGLVLTVDGRVFANGATDLGFTADRTAGYPGSRAEMRELDHPGGLACLNVGGREFVAIADTGNHRMVIWSDTSAYVAKYDDQAFVPMSVATDPADPSAFGVVGRTESGAVSVRGYTFDGSTLNLANDVPLSEPSVNKGGALGIAIAKLPGDPYQVAISDAEGKKVLEYSVAGSSLVLDSTLVKAIGVCAGDPSLEKPLDIAYVQNGGVLQLFALDAGDRLVRIR